MLVGRAHQLEAIGRILAGARIGTSGVLVLTGEPGAGKTVLVEHAAAEAGEAKMQVLRARGIEADRELPFGALLQLLRPAIHLLDEIPRPQADALGAALALRPGTPGDRFAIGAATLSLLCRLAEGAPVAVIVDDLQLVDRPSAEALVFAARRLIADPVAVLFAVRQDADDAGTELTAGLPQVHLAGLDLAESRELLGAGAAAPMSEDELRRLHRATAGNPLGLVELAQHRQDWAHLPANVPLPVPATVAAAFRRQVSALGDATQQLLLVAATSGGDLAITVAAADRLGVPPSALQPALEAGLVRVEGDHLRFRHPLLRSAVLAGAPEELRAVHAVIAAVLPEDDADRRAWHLGEAAWLPDASVSGTLALAANRARDRRAHAVAARTYQRAAELQPDPTTRVELFLAAAESAWEAGLADQARALLDAVAGRSLRPELRIRTLQLRAGIAARTGSLLEARDLLDEAAGSAEVPDEAVELLADAVHTCLYLGDAPGSITRADRLDRILPEVTTSRARALGLTAAGMARVLAGHGGVEQLRTALPLLAESTSLHDDPRRLPWLMLGPLFLRDDSSGEQLRHLVDDMRDRCGVGTLPFLLFHLARDEATTDRWDRAAANYNEAIRIAAETGQQTDLAASMAGLTWLESRQGAGASCRAHAAQALPVCTERHFHLAEVWIRFALGDLALSEGDAAGAVDALTALTALLTRLQFSDPDVSPAPELVDAYTRLGRSEQAGVLAAAYLEAAERKGQPWARARSQRCLGLLAPDHQLDAHFAQALALHAQTPDRFETARTQLAYGARLRRCRRRADARTPLRAALATFDQLGAARWADQAALELGATGETVARAGASRRAALTPQELQVALQLAEGRTNRQAAAALFVSPKTVEYHLRHVYTKLGIHSRSDLVEALAERGDPT